MGVTMVLPRGMSQRQVAILLGGPSPEHDVSVLTGLQGFDALQTPGYSGFPVYIDLAGGWWVGEALRECRNYLPTAAVRRTLTKVQWAVGAAAAQGRWWLEAVQPDWLGRRRRFAVDAVLPALHGHWGEDGTVQGALAAVGVPTAGCGVGAMAVTIDKYQTGLMATALGLPAVPGLLVKRGEAMPSAAAIAVLGPPPYVVKPNRLGSSLGVRVVTADGDVAEALNDAIVATLQLDYSALIQPCIANLIELNVAVRRLADGTVVTSAIEQPERKAATYDFATKYLQDGGGKKMGPKAGPSLDALRGLLSATRTLTPPALQGPKGAKLDATIRAHATTLFEGLNMAGAPRLDFMLNAATGQLYFNEVNPTPGSFGFFLWEGATGPAQVGLTALLSAMLDEARQLKRQRHCPHDPAQLGGVIFTQRGEA